MNRSFTLLSLVCFALFSAVMLLSPTDSYAQKKSAKPAAKSTAKARNAKASDAKQSAKSAKNAKSADKKADKNSKNSAKNRADEKKSKASAKNDDKKSTAKNDNKRQSAAEKRAAAARERQARIEAARREAERRAAAEAERRRREAIRQAAIARARAFENGLRTETQANIAQDDTRGEDLTVRAAAIRALGNRAGSVVVMDAQNGQIITTVNQKWAYGQGYKPCSTIKLVTGIAGKSENVINDYGNVSVKPQRLDLTDALAVSNNGYFQNVGGAVGFPKMTQYARELGLGQTTGINAPNESNGKLPENKTGWSVNRMSSHGDDFEVTPLQLATMVSAITNGGKLLQPQVARSQPEADALRPKVRRNLNISKNSLQTVVPGMIGAVNYGTARRANDPSLNIGGKTGSCIGQGSWLGLFASVAPVASPKYAVVVVTRGQAERGKWASAVAGQVYQALAPKIRALQPLVAGANPQTVAPRPKIDATAVETLSDEGADEADETAPVQVPNNTTPAPSVNQDKSSLVKSTVSVRPVGQPTPAPQTKKGEYKPRSGVIVVPNASPTPNSTPSVKVRPRVVPQ